MYFFFDLRQKSTQTLLDFKSLDLAEQMSLIDLNLFTNIPVRKREKSLKKNVFFNFSFISNKKLSEILLYSTKQNEKTSPNLIRFTQHFNNISYW